MSIDIATLIDIRDAIDRAMTFAEGMDYDEFVHDQRNMWAVYSQIIVIGEAATRISGEFRQIHPHVPWKNMIGMRHRLIHGYDEIKWRKVWETVIEDLPGLKSVIEPLIPMEP